MIENSENLLVDLMNVHTVAINKTLEDCLPCVVTAVKSRTEVTVRPMIKIVDKAGKSYVRADIEGIPVLSSGAGNMVMSMPVSVGSIGWLHANDRDISLFLQSHEDSEPPTQRMHSFSDAYFEPDLMFNFTVAEADDTAIVIQNREGTVKIAIDEGEIRMVAGGINLTLSGDSVSGTAPNGFNLNGFTIAADGAAESPVSLTSPSMVVDGKELKNHTHLGSATAPTGPVSPTGTNL